MSYNITGVNVTGYHGSVKRCKEDPVMTMVIGFCADLLSLGFCIGGKSKALKAVSVGGRA